MPTPLEREVRLMADTTQDLQPVLCEPVLSLSALFASPFLVAPGAVAPLGSMPVIMSAFVGGAIHPLAPAMKKGPYLQRRLKRWHRAYPPYTVGNSKFLIVGDTLVCHRDDYQRLKEALCRAGALSTPSGRKR